VGAPGTNTGERGDASGAVGVLATALSVVAGSAVFVLLARTTAVQLENRGLRGACPDEGTRMSERPRGPLLPVFISPDDPRPMYAQVESQLGDLTSWMAS
jgi:hypothetical protein